MILKGKNNQGEKVMKRLTAPVKNLSSLSVESYSLSFVLENPELWSAEKLDLYDIEIRLYDGKGVIEEFRSHWGIWKCEIDRNIFKFNGKLS